MLEFIATSEPFDARERIDGVLYPANIESLWSAEELAAIGLRVRVESPYVPTLNEAQAQKIAAAWAEHASRFASYIVTVTVNGEARPYGCDPVTRKNILAITNAIALGIQTEPRPFTPKGESAPVQTTYAEFKAIYAAGLAAGDAHYVAYATHKAAINAFADVAGVIAYDVTTGWPV